jgi:hypothetical protein
VLPGKRWTGALGRERVKEQQQRNVRVFYMSSVVTCHVERERERGGKTIDTTHHGSVMKTFFNNSEKCEKKKFLRPNHINHLF